MNKKGFTLVELLAVIVILAIIALIAIPLIGNVIEKAKIGALESSVNGLVESANMYYANNTIKGEKISETIFDFEDGEQISDKKLEYKGKVYNGKLILHANGEVAVCIDDEEHYAYKNKDTDEIVSGNGTCLYDGTTGDFTIESNVDTVIKECESDKQELQNKINELQNGINSTSWPVNARSTGRATSLTYTAEANTSYYLLAYKALSQYPTTSSSVMTVTNATKLDTFNINTTQNNASFDVLNLYKITDRTQPATLTITSGGDYGSPGVMYLALGNISDFETLSVKGSGTTTGTITVPANTKYVVAYMSLSQYYYEGGTAMYPVSNMSVVSGSEIFYGQSGKPFVPVFAVYKVEDESKTSSFYMSSTGDYGNKYVKYIYLG